MWDVSGSETAYWELLSWQWGKEDLVLVEHDMIPADGVVEQMESCWQGWCTSPYFVTPVKFVWRSLGLARFSLKLQEAIPDCWDEVATWEPKLQWANDGKAGSEWDTLDIKLDHVLSVHGYDPHPHFPGPVHLTEGVDRIVPDYQFFEAVKGRRSPYPEAQDLASGETTHPVHEVSDAS
jgi:hypothetical protein